MTKFLGFILVLISIDVLRVEAFNLSIKPDLIRVRTVKGNDYDTKLIICSADVPLIGCQFMATSDTSKEGPLIDVSDGAADLPNYDIRRVINYKMYKGRGLEAGECGIEITVNTKVELTRMFTCRVRAKTGPWKYAQMDYFIIDWDPLPYNLTTPREMVVLPGGEVRVNVKVGEPLLRCRFYFRHIAHSNEFNNYEIEMDRGQSYRNRRYRGAGTELGECGLSALEVTEIRNGMARCYVEGKGRNAESILLTVIVARPPTEPTLKLDYTGTNVTATCEVNDSRPVAKMSWYLDDDIIRQDDTDDSPVGSQDKWIWPWTERSILQTITLNLQPKDHGKDLKCRVNHVTLSQPLEAISMILFTGAATSTKCEVVHWYRVREAEAAARTAELREETAKIALQVDRMILEAQKRRLERAKSGAKAKELRAQAEVARAREEEAWAQNAEEELMFERERRTKSLSKS